MNVVSFLCLLRQESFSAFSYSSRQSHKYTNSRKLTLLIYTNFQLFSLRACFSGNISHFCCLRSGCSGAVVGTRFIASKSLENPSAKTGVFGAGKRKLVFRAFTPHGSKEKIQGTYFKICLTYFKISQTYFLPPENPPGWCRRPTALRAHIRLPARPENADKTQTRPRVPACAGMNRC